MKAYSALTSLFTAAAFALASKPGLAAPPASASAAFDSYVRSVESRLTVQHSSPDRFIVLPPSLPDRSSRLRRSPPLVEHLATNQLPGALLHHWRATLFIPGADAAALDRTLQNFAAYPNLFAPQVERAHAATDSHGGFYVSLRLRQRHVFTVVLDMMYNVTFSRLDPQHRSSSSRSASISEIVSPGTTAEHPLSSDDEHGFLWRQNTYWTWEQCDGGLYIQVESVSLTRSVPEGLGWAIGPYIESIPRDSLEFTLNCISTALLHNPTASA